MVYDAILYSISIVIPVVLSDSNKRYIYDHHGAKAVEDCWDIVQHDNTPQEVDFFFFEMLDSS